MTVFEEFGSAIRSVRDGADAATVAIGRDGRGSGVVIGSGQVLTNAHNLRDRTTTVTFADGRALQATAAGVDGDGDLVVLSVDTGTVAPLTWAERAVDVGDVVFAVARGRGRARVTVGTVSAVGRAFRGPRGRTVEGSIEHTAPLAPGSSGGPLLDARSELVGLNTHRAGRGFYLALPADAVLRARVSALAEGRSPRRRRLGVAIVPSGVARRLRRAVGLPERDGLLVRTVEQGSPAAAAGLREGDLLVRVEGRDLLTADDLFTALDGVADTTVVTVLRGVDELSVTVSFGEETTSQA